MTIHDYMIVISNLDFKPTG